MPLDKARYNDLERSFKAQIERDRVHAVERVVQGWGVYLPCKEPEDQVDYIFVGMEPSFNWADSTEEAEQKIARGFRNFGMPKDEGLTLALFIHSIERFLCQPGESYHLTDVSKGAMPVTVAALDRDRRYQEWYPLLLEEIEIVGKPGAPVIAIGKDVEKFLQGRNLSRNTGRPFYAVRHYSMQASASWKAEAESDLGGFEAFKAAEFGDDSQWPTGLSHSKKQLIFAYKTQFEAIQAHSPK